MLQSVTGALYLLVLPGVRVELLGEAQLGQLRLDNSAAVSLITVAIVVVCVIGLSWVKSLQQCCVRAEKHTRHCSARTVSGSISVTIGSL